MERGPQNHNEDGLLGPNSIMVVSLDPLGYARVYVRAPLTGICRVYARVSRGFFKGISKGICNGSLVVYRGHGAKAQLHD